MKLKSLALACVVAVVQLAHLAQAAPQAALQLDNQSLAQFGYLRVPDHPALEPQQFTLEAWIKPTGAGFGKTTDAVGATIVGKIRENVTGNYLSSWTLTWRPSDGKLLFSVTHTYPSQGTNVVSNGSVALNTSAHVAATFDGVKLRLYINGVLDLEQPYGFTGVYYGPDDVLVGAANYGAGYYRRFQGVIDDVRIWDHARPATSIASLRNCRLAGTEAGLLAYYTFNGSSGLDDSGNGHAATVTGPACTFVAEPVPLSPCCQPASTYCTAKLNSLGCAPAIESSGAASATATSGFVVSATNVLNNKNGLLFYGVSGAGSVPYQGGTLCVAPGIKRTPAVNSGGSPPPNSCTGVFSIDMNAFASGTLGGSPLPALKLPGTLVHCQWWGRDPGFAAPNNTQLSNGLRFVICN